MPKEINGGWPTLDHVPSAYENYPVYETPHYLSKETEDPNVPKSATNFVHGRLSMLQNKQQGLRREAQQLKDRIVEKIGPTSPAYLGRRRVADDEDEITRRFQQIYGRVDVMLRALEANAKLVKQPGTPNVKDLIRFHEAAIENARRRP
jgi:hypothetical protein